METKKFLSAYEEVQGVTQNVARSAHFRPHPTFEKNSGEGSRLTNVDHAPRKEYAAEALIPIVAANPTLAAMLPFVVGGVLGLQMFEKGVNGIRNGDQMDYGYGPGHLLQMLGGVGLIFGGLGMTLHAWKMAVDIGPSVASWAPMIQNATSENLTLLLSNNVAFLFMFGVGFSVATWFLTGGPTRAGDSVANKRRNGKADIAEVMGY